MAIEVMRASVESIEGLKVESSVRDFKMIMDEPESLGGTNTGMNPIEALLSAVGGCKVIVARSFAKMKRIDLEAITIDVEGTLDTDGFTGRNKEAKIGLSHLKTIYKIKANNSEEELKAFVDFIERTCPVIDTIVNAPELEREINIL
ncbi:OsmC family protein [Macrococcus sp. EM39E]|uniref:OsmC family protein n=1 Tax=Macrococcus animalis TaxID=3395467 RepID=UPI0039BDC3DE